MGSTTSVYFWSFYWDGNLTGFVLEIGCLKSSAWSENHHFSLIIDFVILVVIGSHLEDDLRWSEGN